MRGFASLIAPIIAAVIALGAAFACGRDRISVSTETSDDYKQSELTAAVNKFVTAQRTPEAYAALAQTVLKLRPGMDKMVGREAELRLVTLALTPIQNTYGK